MKTTSTDLCMQTLGINQKDISFKLYFSFWRSHLSRLASHDCKMDSTGRANLVHRSKFLWNNFRSRFHLSNVWRSCCSFGMGISFLRHRLYHLRLVRVLVGSSLWQPRMSSQNFKVRKRSDWGISGWQRRLAKNSSGSLEEDLDLRSISRPHGHRHGQLLGHHRPRLQWTYLPEVHAWSRHQDKRDRFRTSNVVKISRRNFSFFGCRLASKASPDLSFVDKKNIQLNFTIRAGGCYDGEIFFFASLIDGCFFVDKKHWKYLINHIK